MKCNLQEIIPRAWRLYREKKEPSFAECLHWAWLFARVEAINAKRIEEAKAAAGVEEETNTWNGWKQLGYEVTHGSKALFGTRPIWGSQGDRKAYKARFFGCSQV